MGKSQQVSEIVIFPQPRHKRQMRPGLHSYHPLNVMCLAFPSQIRQSLEVPTGQGTTGNAEVALSEI
jgi:hypothetical protein